MFFIWGLRNAPPGAPTFGFSLGVQRTLDRGTYIWVFIRGPKDTQTGAPTKGVSFGVPRDAPPGATTFKLSFGVKGGYIKQCTINVKGELIR